MLLQPLVEEVGDGLGLPREGKIAWVIDMDDELRIDADHDQLFRVLSNLVRNAVQAIEPQDARQGADPRHAHRDGRKVIDRGRRRRAGRSGQGARQPVPGLPGLDPQGRHGPRARHRARAGAGPRRHA